MNKELERITLYDLYNHILERMGMNETSCNYYCTLENNDIVYYRDESYHGTPDYKEVKRKHLTDAEAKVLKNLTEIKREIKEVSYSLELDQLLKERENIDARIKIAKQNINNV